jgi:hypothetical protein
VGGAALAACIPRISGSGAQRSPRPARRSRSAPASCRSG